MPLSFTANIQRVPRRVACTEIFGGSLLLNLIALPAATTL